MFSFLASSSLALGPGFIQGQSLFLPRRPIPHALSGPGPSACTSWGAASGARGPHEACVRLLHEVG